MNIKSAARKLWGWIVAGALAVAAFFGYNEAQSQTATDVVSWTMPATRTDGTPLPVTEIARTTVAWGTTPGGPYPNAQDVAAPATTFTFNRGTPGTGTRCYVAFVTDTDGRVGGQSGERCKTVRAAPGSVSGLTVQ